MDQAGVIFDKEDTSDNVRNNDGLADPEYTDLSTQELEEAIKKAVKKEDYEMAARIRDEISKRTNEPEK